MEAVEAVEAVAVDEDLLEEGTGPQGSCYVLVEHGLACWSVQERIHRHPSDTPLRQGV